MFQNKQLKNHLLRPRLQDYCCGLSFNFRSLKLQSNFRPNIVLLSDEYHLISVKRLALNLAIYDLILQRFKLLTVVHRVIALLDWPKPVCLYFIRRSQVASHSSKLILSLSASLSCQSQSLSSKALLGQAPYLMFTKVSEKLFSASRFLFTKIENYAPFELNKIVILKLIQPFQLKNSTN